MNTDQTNIQKPQRMKKIIYSISLGLTLLCTVQCTTEDLDPTLEQIKDLDTSINTVEDLEGLLKGALNRMTQSNYYGRDFIIFDEIRGDHVFANGSSGRFQTPGTYQYIPSNNTGIWTRAYSVIASCNIIINIDPETIQGDTDQLTHVQGQAILLRGLAHFDLLRQYGLQYAGGGALGVPYITEFKGEDRTPSRNAVTEVVANIYRDFDEAYTKMSSTIDADKEYPSKFAAKALESRLALYMGEWSKAAAAAKTVLDSGNYTILEADGFVDSFKTDSAANSIFELAFSDTDNVGINGLGYIYRGENYGDIEVLPSVLQLYDTLDVRYKILGYEGDKLRNMGKYPELQGYDNVSVIRIEEVILNYAEALFEQGNAAGAIQQLNTITAKRGAGATTYSNALTKEDILEERQRELIFEGFRFFDLTRTQKGIPIVHSLQNIQTPISANDHRFALPIPLTEMDANSNMEQNPGYN